MHTFFKRWFASGEPWIWMNAAAVGISVAAVVGIIGLIGVKGFAHFWPNEVLTIEYQTERGGTGQVYAELVQTEALAVQQFLESGGDADLVSANQEALERWLVKTGNRKHNPPDFRWVIESQISDTTIASGIVVLERIEWGNAYGIPTQLTLTESNEVIKEPTAVREKLAERVERANELREQIDKLEMGTLNHINYRLERLRLAQRKLTLEGVDESSQAQEIADEVAQLRQDYAEDEQSLRKLYKSLNQDELVLTLADGKQLSVPVAEILSHWYPNDFSLLGRAGHFFSSIWRFLSDDPREANTEGGIFPAIFGTVLMVLLMSVLVTPFGVIAAVYLREYATQGVFVRIIRIAVNNLAGVPSIVYGVFGLGFFVYFLGGNIDQLFYAEALPAPTFGTPGLVWASLTLALLTVPVVIVSTEEGLTRIPRSLREGSLALGATKSETLFKIILPMASPAILTGVILAVARAAGEVAPLMLVGVVKLAPTLPLDGNFPYLHLDRKFMHLGFHIYDVGFQSPNVEAARPLVYATALLLITIIVALNLTAITLRGRLERRYRGVES